VRTLAGVVFGVILSVTLSALDKGPAEIGDIFAAVHAGLAHLEAGLPLQPRRQRTPGGGTGRRSADRWAGRAAHF
jgi:hypothetical protein